MPDGREPPLPLAADRRGWPVLHRMHALVIERF